MQELPQALPVVQTLQQAMGSAGGVAGAGSLPRLAVAVTNNNPSIDAQILNPAFTQPPRSLPRASTAQQAQP
jgi:hypothetical protein